MRSQRSGLTAKSNHGQLPAAGPPASEGSCLTEEDLRPQTERTCASISRDSRRPLQQRMQLDWKTSRRTKTVRRHTLTVCQHSMWHNNADPCIKMLPPKSHRKLCLLHVLPLLRNVCKTPQSLQVASGNRIKPSTWMSPRAQERGTRDNTSAVRPRMQARPDKRILCVATWASSKHVTGRSICGATNLRCVEKTG